MRAFAPAVALLATALGACTADHQFTSGADYIARYASSEPTSSRMVKRRVGPDGAFVDEIPSPPSVDELVREVAAVEPILRLPARIGLARLHRGRFAEVPEEEAAVWREKAARYAHLGEFALVDPLVARMAVSAAGEGLDWTDRRRLEDAITAIRLGAARQHLDAVLVYEVEAAAHKALTPLAFADVTLIGGAILPTRSIEATASARALLVDVRNGYPYGTASAMAQAEELSPSWGSDARRDAVSDRAAELAFTRLGSDVEQMLSQVIAASSRSGSNLSPVKPAS